uniref:Coiled-coil domain-containing protein 91-like n=1 Tax=Saccoglossus kowalevskii TaxID=10224 RepID=A0ABM0M6X8_SACKO|nr:PREDICTED: coiled-coil domain-containing protein 91-like [Saccoglossus kowalevskii]
MTDWANFSNTAAQEGDDRIADNAVGDWGNDEDDDFGGFETADPPEVASQAVQLASPSPWASFPPTVASPGQPDLLQAQSLPQPSACSLDSDPIFVNKR